MKSFYKLLYIAFVLSFVTSCSDVVDFETLAVPMDVTEISDPYLVSLNTLNRYLTVIKDIPETKADDVDVTAVVQEGDTVMYLVNYPEGGWELLSADKRVPTRLMIGEKGSMTLQEIEEHPGISIFLDDMRHQISEVKHSNQTDPVTDKGIMWEYINSTPVTTKVNDINWNLYDTEIVHLNPVFVDHLIETQWCQGKIGTTSRWYNKYVPYINSERNNTTSGRCVTGCVPVACAQILNYLQPKLGFSTGYSFLECICDTHIAEGDTVTTYGILNPKVSTYKANDIYWSYVRRVTGTQLEQDNAIATLMAHLGYQLKSRYKLVYRDSDSTWVRKTSTPMTEVENCFSSCYNIDCNYVNWDTDTVIEQLDNEMPVIVAASSSSGSGHCWIVDGYYVAETVINYKYMGIDPSNPYEPVYKTVQVANGVEQYFLMNWGWNGLGDDDVYYVDSSNWYVSGRYYLLSTRSMVYGFN